MDLAEQGPNEDDLASSAEALTVPQYQALMNSFYDFGNSVKVLITMPEAEWQALKEEQPVGGRCNFEYPPNNPVDRFPWHPTMSVEVRGTRAPAPMTAYNVEIKKKSYCGSFDTTKPSLKLKFQPAAADILGTSYLTLNNSIQDRSFIRQCLGYKLFGMAGLPRSRCNLALVYVNGFLVSDGIYVNVEQIRQRFIDNPDNGFTNKTGGNLYEFELGDDFVANRVQYVDVEDGSKYATKTDLTAAAADLAMGRALNRTVDVNHFIKMYAMEFLLKHWDGYTDNRNNTYVYNDVNAVPNPTAGSGQIKFKLIPWGLDQILKSSQSFQLDNDAIPANYVRDDPTGVGPAYYNQLIAQIKTYGDTVFGRSQQSGTLKAFIDQAESQLTTIFNEHGWTQADRTAILHEIYLIRVELQKSRSMALQMGGLPTNVGLYIREWTTGDALLGSGENLGPAGGVTYEVTNEPMPSTTVSSLYRWVFEIGSLGPYRFTNEYDNRRFHSSSTMKSALNHFLNYRTASGDSSTGAQDYYVEREASAEPWTFSGGARFRNHKTSLYLRFGNDDLTAGGKKRVYQDSFANASLLRFY